MIVGIVGCGAIANTIVNEILSEEGIEIKYFYDRDVERAENIAQLANGIAVIELEDMIDKVDLIVEAASPMALKEIALPILEKGVKAVELFLTLNQSLVQIISLATVIGLLSL